MCSRSSRRPTRSPSVPHAHTTTTTLTVTPDATPARVRPARPPRPASARAALRPHARPPRGPVRRQPVQRLRCFTPCVIAEHAQNPAGRLTGGEKDRARGGAALHRHMHSVGSTMMMAPTARQAANRCAAGMVLSPTAALLSFISATRRAVPLCGGVRVRHGGHGQPARAAIAARSGCAPQPPPCARAPWDARERQRTAHWLARSSMQRLGLGWMLQLAALWEAGLPARRQHRYGRIGAPGCR